MTSEVMIDPAAAVQQVLARPAMLSLAYQPIVDMSRGEAAGLEETDDLVALVEAGIPLAQGYLLGHPGVVMTDLEPGPHELVLDAIARTTRSEDMSTLIQPYADDDERTPPPQVVVTGDNMPVAVVVTGGEPTVRTVPVSLRVNLSMAVTEVARRAMARTLETRFDPVVVVDTAGSLVGVFTVDELMLHLASITEACGSQTRFAASQGAKPTIRQSFMTRSGRCERGEVQHQLVDGEDPD